MPSTCTPSSCTNLSSKPWENLSLRRIVRHFSTLSEETKVEKALALSTGLLEEEKVILRFLYSVYGGSEATIQLYARYTSGLLNYARMPSLLIEAEHVDAYVRSFEKAGAKPATCTVITAALKSFFRHLQDRGDIVRNPMSMHKKKRTMGKAVLAGHLTHSLGEEDIAALLDGLAQAEAPLRDRALFALLFMTGLRAEELVKLTWSSLVQWQGEHFLDVQGKGHKARRIYVPAPAMSLLIQYRDHVPGGYCANHDLPLLGHVRDARKSLTRHGVYALVKKWCINLLGRRAVSPHWFRHTCFTQLALKGVPLEAIKALAGHESVETTMRYNEAAALMQSPGKIFEKTPKSV